MPQTEPSRRPFIPAALALAAGLLLGLGAWFFGPTMGQPVLAEVRGSDVTFERGTELVAATTGTRFQPADMSLVDIFRRSNRSPRLRNHEKRYHNGDVQRIADAAPARNADCQSISIWGNRRRTRRFSRSAEFIPQERAP